MTQILTTIITFILIYYMIRLAWKLVGWVCKVTLILVGIYMLLSILKFI
jgi:hypothetical protein